MSNMMNEQVPPEVLAALGGGMGDPNGAPAEPAAGGGPGQAEDQPDLKSAIDMLRKVSQAETDDADTAILDKVIAELQKLLAANQDAELQAMGANPKQMRTLGKSYGAQ